MARALESRIAKLEKGDRGTDDGGPFYLLWVEPGEDRAMALAAAHRQGSLADVPIFGSSPARRACAFTMWATLRSVNRVG